MAPDSRRTLRGRQRECAELDRVVDDIRSGRSRVLVVSGDAGIGKTALLDELCDRGSGCRVVRAAGVEAELELPFAALHQLLTPLLEHLPRLPDPQADALGVAFGLRAGGAPDRFLVGLAVLTLLSDAAEERPLICVVDDVQWLDHASRQALVFAARRLMAESVAVVFAVREPGAADLAGLPGLELQGLSDRDASALLDSAVTGPLDERVRDRIVAETRGNPLALLELPRGLSPMLMAGGFGLSDAPTVSTMLEDSFVRRLTALPAQTCRLLLVAAAEPLGDPVLLFRAADRLGIDGVMAQPAVAAGLVDIGARVRFGHPLMRSAIYHAASTGERRDAHRVLAEATDPDDDPDRRAWHRARAVAGLDEGVARELERSAGRAQARGGLAAGAAFLERAAELTPEPARRAERALSAASAEHLAGAPEAALRMLAIARAGALDDFGSARADLLRAQIAFATTRGRDAAALLLRAAG
ncbi:MAG TPA: ATP-binding protein, partial [Pseudonocardia sp.]